MHNVFSIVSDKSSSNPGLQKIFSHAFTLFKFHVLSWVYWFIWVNLCIIMWDVVWGSFFSVYSIQLFQHHFLKNIFPFLLNHLALLSKIKPTHFTRFMPKSICLPDFLSGNLIFESELTLSHDKAIKKLIKVIVTNWLNLKDWRLILEKWGMR